MIIDTVIEHGKISLGDLPNYLMIGQDSIQNRIEHVLKKSNIRLVDDCLISS
jgi:E3 UFM1-protein ligase 1